jgi:hypothetical protein
VEAAMIALMVLALLIIASFVAMVIVYRATSVLRAASPTFLLIILVGAALGCFFVLVATDSEDSKCYMPAVLLSCSFSLVFGALFSKTRRIAY